MSYQLIKDENRKARKPHRCIWCGEGIPAKSMYKYERSRYDNEHQSHHWHFECWDDSQECFCSGDEEFVPYENERPRVEAFKEDCTRERGEKR